MAKRAAAGAPTASGGSPWLERRKPLEREETLKSKVIRLIREAIVDGTIPAGTPVSIASVASWLGVSPTPVREATMHLAEAGLLTIGKSGVTVVELTERSLRNAFEVREALEGMAARQAAERRTDAHVPVIRRHAEESLAAAAKGDAEAFRKCDYDFHHAIAEAAANPQLERYVGNAHDLSMTLRNLSTARRSLHADSAGLHLKVVDAIEARDGETAECVMRSHIRSVLESVVLLQQQDETEEASKTAH